MNKKYIQIPNLFLILSCIFLFSASLTRIQINSGFSLNPLDFLGLFSFLYLLVSRRFRFEKLQLPLYTKFWLLFICASFFSWIIAFFTTSYPLAGVFYIFRLVSVYLFAFFLFNTDFSPQKYSKLLGGALLTGAILGLVQYIFLPDARFLIWSGWDNHLNRLIGTYLDPGYAGLMFLLGIVFFLTQKKLSQFPPTILIVALALTYSRATYLAAFVVFFMGFFVFPRRKTYFFLILSLSSLIFFLPRTAGEGVKLERSYSIESRTTSINSAFVIFRSHPLIGIGMNNYSYLKSSPQTSIPSHSNSPDNSYLFVLATTGILGFSLFSIWILNLMKYSYPNSPRIFLSVLAVSVHALFNNSWFYLYVLFWIWIIIAIHNHKPTANKSP